MKSIKIQKASEKKRKEEEDEINLNRNDIIKFAFDLKDIRKDNHFEKNIINSPEMSE